MVQTVECYSGIYNFFSNFKRKDATINTLYIVPICARYLHHCKSFTQKYKAIYTIYKVKVALYWSPRQCPRCKHPYLSLHFSFIRSFIVITIASISSLASQDVSRLHHTSLGQEAYGRWSKIGRQISPDSQPWLRVVERKEEQMALAASSSRDPQDKLNPQRFII